MPIEIRMPALSPTMTEGNLTRWLKKEGDEVHSGDVIAEIETDKATMEYEAVDEGRIGKIIVPEGAQGIKVNQPIALLLEEGEDAAALEKFAAAPAGDGQRDAPGHRPPPRRVETDRPAFLLVDRLHDRRAAEGPQRAQRQVGDTYLGQRFRDPRRCARLAPGAGRQRVMERRGDHPLGAGR